MAHVVAANDAGAIGEPVGMGPICRAQQQRGRVDRAARDNNNVAAVPLDGALPLHHHLRHLAAGGAGLDALDIGARQ